MQWISKEGKYKSISLPEKYYNIAVLSFIRKSTLNTDNIWRILLELNMFVVKNGCTSNQELQTYTAEASMCCATSTAS